jgi:hypothetical protein
LQRVSETEVRDAVSKKKSTRQPVNLISIYFCELLMQKVLNVLFRDDGMKVQVKNWEYHPKDVVHLG